MSIEEIIADLLEREGEEPPEPPKPPPREQVDILEAFPRDRILFSGVLSLGTRSLPLLMNRPPIAEYAHPSPIDLLRLLTREWRYMLGVQGPTYANNILLDLMEMTPIEDGYIIVGDTFYLMHVWHAEKPVYLMVRGDHAVVRSPDEVFRVAHARALQVITRTFNNLGLLAHHSGRIEVWVDLNKGKTVWHKIDYIRD